MSAVISINSNNQVNQDVMRTLPPELKLEIFSYLSPRSLAITSLVSREWKVLADDSVIWKGKLRTFFSLLNPLFGNEIRESPIVNGIHPKIIFETLFEHFQCWAIPDSLNGRVMNIRGAPKGLASVLYLQKNIFKEDRFIKEIFSWQDSMEEQLEKWCSNEYMVVEQAYTCAESIRAYPQMVDRLFSVFPEFAKYSSFLVFLFLSVFEGNEKYFEWLIDNYQEEVEKIFLNEKILSQLYQDAKNERSLSCIHRGISILEIDHCEKRGLEICLCVAAHFEDFELLDDIESNKFFSDLSEESIFDSVGDAWAKGCRNFAIRLLREYSAISPGPISVNRLISIIGHEEFLSEVSSSTAHSFQFDIKWFKQILDNESRRERIRRISSGEEELSVEGLLELLEKAIKHSEGLLLIDLLALDQIDLNEKSAFRNAIMHCVRKDLPNASKYLMTLPYGQVYPANELRVLIKDFVSHTLSVFTYEWRCSVDFQRLPCSKDLSTSDFEQIVLDGIIRSIRERLDGEKSLVDDEGFNDVDSFFDTRETSDEKISFLLSLLAPLFPSPTEVGQRIKDCYALLKDADYTEAASTMRDLFRLDDRL